MESTYRLKRDHSKYGRFGKEISEREYFRLPYMDRHLFEEVVKRKDDDYTPSSCTNDYLNNNLFNNSSFDFGSSDSSSSDSSSFDFGGGDFGGGGSSDSW